MTRSRRRHRARALRTVEWPTVLVATTIYGGWLAATAWHAAIPLPLLVVLGGWIVAWHGSLQHETIHGHPTGRRRIDAAIGFAPLALYLPYALYRRSHVAHHGSRAITDPHADPESRYLDRPRGAGWLAARFQATLPGHMLFGPPIAVLRLLRVEASRLRSAPGQMVRDWVAHLIAGWALVAWLDHVGMGLGSYVLTFVYPGMALSTLRAHAEHRAGSGNRSRAATVERGGVFALLFLNNNLHAAHHDRPLLAWYRLPAYHHAHRARLTGSGAALYAGYSEIVRRFAFRAHDEVLHPRHREPVS